MTGNLFNGYPKIDRRQRFGRAMKKRFGVTRFPPQWTLLQQFINLLSGRLPVCGFRNFLECSEDDYTRPLLRVLDLVHFNASERVGA
jgi:hypothetical protein